MSAMSRSVLPAAAQRKTSRSRQVSAITELQRKDVRFADYDLPGLKTVNHIATMGAEKAAWFEDTEGNFLCVHQDLE
jgi:hypothetical protein